MAAGGSDFDELGYRDWLTESGVDRSHLYVFETLHTAVGGIDLVLIGRDDPGAILRHTQVCRERGIDFAVDPSGSWRQFPCGLPRGGRRRSQCRTRRPGWGCTIARSSRCQSSSSLAGRDRTTDHRLVRLLRQGGAPGAAGGACWSPTPSTWFVWLTRALTQVRRRVIREGRRGPHDRPAWTVRARLLSGCERLCPASLPDVKLADRHRRRRATDLESVRSQGVTPVARRRPPTSTHRVTNRPGHHRPPRPQLH